MDLMAIVTPGAQSLVTALLADGWERVRTALSIRWSRRTGEPQAEVERRLDDAYGQIATTDESDTASRRAMLEAHWTAYLARTVATQPELLDVLQDFATHVVDGSGDVHNTNSGTATTLVQARDIQGGITFGTGHP